MLSRDGEHAEPASWSGPPSKQPVVTHSYLRNRWCCPGYSAMNQVSTPIVLWAKMHRIHHKYSDTTSDPHDARRGFFFSHIGWLLSTKHPDFLAKMKEVRLRAALGLALTSAQEVHVQCFADSVTLYCARFGEFVGLCVVSIARGGLMLPAGECFGPGKRPLREVPEHVPAVCPLCPGLFRPHGLLLFDVW